MKSIPSHIYYTNDHFVMSHNIIMTMDEKRYLMNVNIEKFDDQRNFLFGCMKNKLLSSNKLKEVMEPNDGQL